MLKRLLSLGAAALAAATAACEDGPATVAGTFRSPATWSSMVYASSKGPMLVEIFGDPFGLPGPEFRALVAGAMSGRAIGRVLSFTLDAEEAAHPNFRVVVAFNAPDTQSVDDLCARKVATAPGRTGKITVQAAFCDGRNQPLASVSGWVAKVEGPADPRFGRLMGQIVRELFGEPN